jgi:hypothetical protein
MYPSLPAGQATPYPPDAYSQTRQWSAPLPERQPSAAPASPPCQQVPQRQTSVHYNNQMATAPPQMASPPPLSQEPPHMDSDIQPQTAPPPQAMSPPPHQAQRYETLHSQQPLQEGPASPSRAREAYAYPSYPSVPSQAPAANGTYALPSFPAFPDAPTANPPEPQKPVEREQPKEALLIEL